MMRRHLSRLLPGRRACLAGASFLLALTGLVGLPATQSPRALPGDLPLARIPESADLRSADLETLLKAPIRELRTGSSRILRNASGRWKRDIIASGDAVYLLYAAERDGAWPLHGQGSWILKRERASGAFVQAKIFIKSDPGTFIRLFPDGDRTRMDLVVYGGVFHEGIALPFSFERCLDLRSSEIFAASRMTVDWALFEAEPVDYRVVADLAGAIRKRLPALRYAEDGGLDAAGRPVFIADGREQALTAAGLNCSGFAQWVVDGLVRPRTGAWIGIEGLLTKHLDTRKSKAVESFEDALDPYFGLDWTRNLALAALEALEEPVIADIRDSDITEAPFALVAAQASPVNGNREYEDFAAYTEDAGFASEGLPALLWWLALKEPGDFYLASVSEQDRAGLRHHYHVAVLLPWFDEGGVFRVDVFESAAETSLLALLGRTKGQMMHLSRIKAERDFDPPTLPARNLP